MHERHYVNVFNAWAKIFLLFRDYYLASGVHYCTECIRANNALSKQKKYISPCVKFVY